MLTRYRNLVISGFAGKPTKVELTEIEHKLGTRLPEDFVEFLNVANGGDTEFSVKVPPAPEGEPIGFSRLNSTKPNQQGEYGSETFIGAIELARQFQNIPHKVLPLADDGGGSVFYLDLTPEGQGRVVVFRHGSPEWTGRPSKDAYIEVASSFVDFVDLLYIEPDIAEIILEDAIATQDEEEIAAVKTVLDSGLPDWRERLGVDF